MKLKKRQLGSLKWRFNNVFYAHDAKKRYIPIYINHLNNVLYFKKITLDWHILANYFMINFL